MKSTKKANFAINGDITCVVRNARNEGSVVTKPLDSDSDTKVGVCPRIVSLENPGTQHMYHLGNSTCRLRS